MINRGLIIRRILCLTVCVSALSVGVRAQCRHEYQTNIIPAGCVTPGVYEEYCIHCGAMGRVESIEPTGHQYVSETIAPTCTENGYTLHRCVSCSYTYQDGQTAPTGHSYDGGVLTKEPTLTAMGRITYTCRNCGDTYQETTPKLTNPFEDVKPKNYFYDSVLWAANRGITSGVDAVHFGPNQVCTRGQVMVFLWRAEGSPEPASNDNPFVDVGIGDYFQKAVLWAFHAGITAGVDAGHFSPHSPCTRAQVVTFLHSAKGKAVHSDVGRFQDVTHTAYYYDAVQWAAENSVTTGVSDGIFAPNQRCDRGQIVTFLYKARKL